MNSKPLPERRVVLGRIVAPYGVKGWVKIQPYAAKPQSLTGHRAWWLGRDGSWRECAVERAQPHGNTVVAKLEGCEDRDAAARMKGMDIAVPRDALPPAEPGEYYWTDLIGLKVENEQAIELGMVDRMMETGANDVLVVEGERERLIPFIAPVVKRVDLEAGLIVVDWDADY